MIEVFQGIIKENVENQAMGSPWVDQPFEEINDLKNDYSGKTGEVLIQTLCNTFGIPNVYDEDINSKDGTYDIVIKSKQDEIKTARISKCGAFQHENLKNEGCDYYLFVDVMPDRYFITVLNARKFDLSTRNDVIGRTPHLRDKTTGVYKFDFSEKNIRSSISQGYSIEVTQHTNPDDIKVFLERIIE